MGDQEPKSSGPAPAYVSTVIRRAYREFMAIPAYILLGFVGLAVCTLLLDSVDAGWVRQGRDFLTRYIFRVEHKTADLLGTILSGLLTLISITFSVLLLAVQQTASTLTNQVYDQFLRRKVNQIYFGFSVGLAVYTLLILATVGDGFNPVYSTVCVVLLTVFALGLLILLIYGTIDQMRPSVIIQSIHDHVLRARGRQRALVRRTRREPRSGWPARAEVRAEIDGFLQRIDLDCLTDPLREAGPAEVVVQNSVGTYAARGDVLATIRSESAAAAARLVPAVRKALHLEPERDLDHDPAWGIVELENVAWTTTSSAKSAPEPPRLTINALRDMLARWSDQEAREQPPPEADVLPVVYHDNVYRQAIDTLATIAAGAKESYQHMILADAFRAFGLLYEAVNPPLQAQVLDTVRRIIPALQPLVFTHNLEEALGWLADTLGRHGQAEAAGELEAARREMEKRIGRVSG